MVDPKGLPFVVEQIELIQKQLEDIQNRLRDNSNLEATAAKIITDLTVEINDCHCKTEIADLQRQIFEKIEQCECTQPLREMMEQLLKTKVDTAPPPPVKTTSKLKKYSYPNFDVGNAELGSSANPKPMKWPYGGPQD